MKKPYVVAMIVAFVSILSIVIAYAALSTTLTITMNKVTQNAMTWNVAFNAETVAGTAVGTSATGRVCGSATATANAVTVADTTLSKPGDACYYKFTVKNTGSIAATLASVTPTEPSGITCTKTNASTSASAQMVCGNITYKLVASATHSGTTITTTNLVTGTALAASTGTQDVYLVAQYTGSSLNSSAVTHTGGKFTLVYDQA